MSKSFSYTLSQFKRDVMTFYNMKPSYFIIQNLYQAYIIQNLYQKGLDGKLFNTVSLAKVVLNNIKNACSTFLVKDVLVSLCAKILQL